MTNSNMRIGSKGGALLVRSLLIVGLFLCFSSAAFAQLTITTASLPGGGVGTPYAGATLAATGGTGTLTWTVSVGSLPAGLTLSAGGVISGTPTAPGSGFTIQVTDSTVPTPQTATKGFSVAILSITTASLPGGGVGTPYVGATMTATGGTGTLTWSVSAGALPAGLVLSPAGVISGTPTAPGSGFTIQVTDSSVPALTSTKAFTITILAVTTASPMPNGQVGAVYAVPALSAANGTGSLTWSITAGSLPPGLTLTGPLISGTPTIAGTFTFTVHVIDSSVPQLSANKDLTISIPPLITTASLPNGLINTAYSSTLTAAPSIATPLTWSLMTAGTLPAGLNLAAATGVISGTPTATGTFNFTIRLTDSSVPPLTGLANLSITITSTLTITTTSPLPVGVTGAFYNQNLTAAGVSPVTWTILSGIAPPGISLATNGALNGTPTVAGTFNFTVQASGGTPTQTVSKPLVLVINPILSITTFPNLPGATPGVAYTTTLVATGGVSPYTWTNTTPLPPGITLSAAGVLSGTPTSAGTFNFTVQVSDSFTPILTTSRNFSLTVVGTLTVVTTSLPNGAVGKTYSQGVSAFAGSGTYTWSVTGGALPDGLTMGTDGTISGTPGSAATFNFTVSVTDTSTPPQTATKALSIVVQPALTITTTTNLPLGVVGAFYSQLLAATGPTPLTWGVVSGITPPGLSVTPSGALAGTPSVSGTFDLTVQVRGGDPLQTATANLHMVVNDALSIVTAATLPDAPLGGNYSVTLEAKGGLSPYTWTTQGGGLPAGVTLSSAGVLSGTPTGVGTFIFTIQVADSFNPTQRVSRTFSLAVSTVVSITTTTLPHAIQNAAYSQQLQASGTAPFTWVVSVGTLPTGITLNATGSIQGTPTDLSSQTFTVRVTDGRGGNATKDFTLVVDPALPAFSVPGLPATLPTRQATDVGVNLAAPFPSALTGQLKLTFTSIAEVPSDDPMTQFSTGTRLVSFSIPANTTVAVFTSKIMLLTGTVAGNVKLTASIDNGPSDLPVASVDIPAVAPQITDITATRGAGGLDVQITGYAPSRRVSSVEFSFDVKSGNTTTKVPLSRTVDGDFAIWFTNPSSVSFGSAFSFVQSFTIQGDPTAVTGVTVRLTNAQGSTTSTTVQPK